jgi:ketosteroid isomerase-like protein
MTMFRVLARSALAVVFASPVAAQEAPRRDPPQEGERIAGIDSARQVFLDALATKDTARIRIAFTDDAITLFAQSAGGQTNTGLPAIVAFYGGLFVRVRASLEMRFTPGPVARTGDSALETGAWTMPGFGTSGRYTTVYRRTPDGRWRIAFWRAGPAGT